MTDSMTDAPYGRGEVITIGINEHFQIINLPDYYSWKEHELQEYEEAKIGY